MLNMLGNYRPLFERFIIIVRENVHRTLYANIDTTNSNTRDGNTTSNASATLTSSKKNK